MACRTCGSDWTTIAGKDCNRCPKCDRLQRCIARKQGRLPAQISKSCGICGVSFEVEPTRQHAKTCESPVCRAEWSRRIRVQNKKQLGFKPKAVRCKMRPKKTCCRDGCNCKVKDNKHDYCSRACAGLDAKEFKRSFLGMSSDARKAKAFAEWMHDWESQRVSLARQSAKPLCDVCQSPTSDAHHRFCSRSCMKAWQGEKQCMKCGNIMQRASWCATVCVTCKQETARKRRKAHRNNFRRRARHFLVEYFPIQRQEVYRRDGWKCQLCGKLCKRKWLINKKTGLPHPLCPTIDHIVPMSKGGGHVMHNVQLACWKCNTIKGARSKGQLLLAWS